MHSITSYRQLIRKIFIFGNQGEIKNRNTIYSSHCFLYCARIKVLIKQKQCDVGFFNFKYKKYNILKVI